MTLDELLQFLRRDIVDRDISSNDGLVIRLCCTNNHAVGGH
jgi:hypothetical protein